MMINMTTHTFDEWNKKGFYIKKGSKTVGFKDGKPLFDKSQVMYRIQSEDISIRDGLRQ